MRAFTFVAASISLFVSACSSSAPASFSVDNASVDASYSCPRGANNSPYDLHAAVRLHNPTAQPVIVEAVRANLTLGAVKGPWLQKIGDTYQVNQASFGPGIVNAGSSIAMKVTIPSACTNGRTATGAASYGDYRVRIQVVTSAGTFSIAPGQLHRIAAA